MLKKTKIRDTIKNYKLSNLNFRLIFYVLTITGIGILAIGSATESSDTNYMLRQGIGFAVGIVAMTFFALFSYRFLFKFYWVMYGIMIGLLLLVNIVGTVSNGARRWINIAGIQFQPSEFAKIFLVIFLSAYLYRHRDRLDTFRTIASSMALAAIPMALIFMEPDLSTTIVIFVTFCVIMFLSGIHYKIITAVLVIAIPVVCVLGCFIIQPDTGKKILEEYQYNRLVGFFQEDNEEAEEIRYQQENSLLAIGSGGLTGKGLFNDDSTSVKNGNLLSEAHTDFIFTIIGEELGFIGSAAVIILLFLIVLECFITGSRAPTMSGRLFCFGLGALIATQSFVNIAVATMLLPNTGVTLPFVSYGLTSLLSLNCGIGIVLNIGLQRNKARI